MARPTDQQLREQRDRALDAQSEGCPFPGMSYSDGVQAALDFALGDSTDAPMED